MPVLVYLSYVWNLIYFIISYTRKLYCTPKTAMVFWSMFWHSQIKLNEDFKVDKVWLKTNTGPHTSGYSASALHKWHVI